MGPEPGLRGTVVPAAAVVLTLLLFTSRMGSALVAGGTRGLLLLSIVVCYELAVVVAMWRLVCRGRWELGYVLWLGGTAVALLACHRVLREPEPASDGECGCGHSFAYETDGG
jgi:hypothetical protein